MRAWIIACLAGAAALASLCLPAAAMAGTYTWALPANFTATGTGANPDHDPYGGTPWTYVEGAPGLTHSHDPSTFQVLPRFSTGIRGGLAGWTDTAATSGIVAVNPTGSTIVNGADSFPPGQVVMSPGADRLVAIGWTSPLSHATSVNVTGSVNADDPNPCPLGSFNWSLDQNGSALQSSSAAGPISASPVVPAGGTIYLTLDYSLVYSAGCDTAGVTLRIVAQENNAPHLTLDSPANGGLISGGQPTFSGSASTAFGASGKVTVRVWSGTSKSGTPVQTLNTTRRGSGYSVGPNAPLADGLYTAQAEQEDTSSPPDAGFSNSTTFRVHNAAPTVSLASPGAKPLHTTTPTLGGVAGTGSGDAHSVALVIYPGRGTNGTPVRQRNASVGSGGRYSARVKPGLADGQYTGIAVQTGAGSTGFSAPKTFRIKVHPPTVTLESPVSGANVNQTTPVFSGTAGTALGDATTVTVVLHGGGSTRGRTVGTLRARARGGTWSGRWARQLAVGLYTAVATQSDDAGNTGTSKAHTFLIVPPPSVIGPRLGLTAGGIVSLSITCMAPAGAVCSGDVLAVTADSFRPVTGGPAGPIRVLFAYVSIPAGQSQVVKQSLSPEVTRTLRHAHGVEVRVTARLSASGGATNTSSALRLLQTGG